MELPLKPNKGVETLRSIVRPVVTLGLVAAYVGLLIFRTPETAAHLKEFVMMVMTFYFLDRVMKRKEAK